MVLISDSSPLWLRNVHVIQFGTHCCLQNPTQRFSKPLGVHTRRWNARCGQNRSHWRPLWVHTQNMVLCADFQKNIFVIPARETNETKLTQNNPVSINSKWLFYSLLIKSKRFTSCKWFSFLSKCLNRSIFIIIFKNQNIKTKIGWSGTCSHKVQFYFQRSNKGASQSKCIVLKFLKC